MIWPRIKVCCFLPRLDWINIVFPLDKCNRAHPSIRVLFPAVSKICFLVAARFKRLNCLTTPGECLRGCLGEVTEISSRILLKQEPRRVRWKLRLNSTSSLCSKFRGQIIECETSRLSNEFPPRQHTWNHHSAVKQDPVHNAGKQFGGTFQNQGLAFFVFVVVFIRCK